MKNTPLILKAVRFAEAKHAGQVRKSSGVDYMIHPLLVAMSVVKYKESKKIEQLVAAALLHDTLEDTDTTEEELVKEFGLFVASLVLELTSDVESVAYYGKTQYLMRKLPGMSNYGLLLKLLDRLNNLHDSPKERTKEETRAILVNLKKQRKLTRSQKAVVRDIERLL